MLLKEIFFYNKKIHNQLTNLNIFKNIKKKKKSTLSLHGTHVMFTLIRGRLHIPITPNIISFR